MPISFLMFLFSSTKMVATPDSSSHPRIFGLLHDNDQAQSLFIYLSSSLKEKSCCIEFSLPSIEASQASYRQFHWCMISEMDLCRAKDEMMGESDWNNHSWTRTPHRREWYSKGVAIKKWLLWYQVGVFSGEWPGIYMYIHMSMGTIITTISSSENESWEMIFHCAHSFRDEWDPTSPVHWHEYPSFRWSYSQPVL